MMSIGILQNRKNKRILFVVFLIFVCLTTYFGLQAKNNSNSYLYKQLASKEFLSVSGEWRVVEYLGEGVEYHETEIKTEAQKIEEDTIVTGIKEKYLDKKLVVDKKYVTIFGPPTELGYYIPDWYDLFGIYRQSPNVLNDISPPFLCASFKLKGYDDDLDIIMDDNGIAVLVVKGQFFRLGRIN